MKINGNEYRNVPIDFNAVCKLEDMGVDISNIDGKIMTVARAYAALCMRKPLEAAGKEIEEHVQNGGTLNSIYEVFAAEVEKSGFFRALQKQTEEAAKDEVEDGEA